MPYEMISEWNRTRFRLPGWSHTLDVFTASHSGFLPESGRAYWEGRLENLTLIPSSPNAVVHQGCAQPGLPSCYFKRFLGRRWPHAIKDFWRTSRAYRAFRQGEVMHSHGIEAPRPVCFLEERRFGVVMQSGLITQSINDAPCVRKWLNDASLRVGTAPRRRAALMKLLATEIARFHLAGLHHGDLRIGNILCRHDSTETHFYFLDNESNGHRLPLPESWRVHNLVQLGTEQLSLSLTDRLRFWIAYAQSSGLSSDEALRLRQIVLDATISRWRKVGWLS